MNTRNPLSPQMALVQLVIASLVGIVMFFVPVTIGGKSTILFDHAASYLVREVRWFAVGAFFLMMAYGAAMPFVNGSWRKSLTDTVISLFKVFGLLVAIAFVAGWLPEALVTPDMVPFLYEKLGLALAMIIPVGALVLAFLIGFGLLEMIGVIMEPLMRKLWKTPGFSAIDAVASFVGSYSVGLLITDQVYAAKKYTAREAAIIATGFSTVSAAFMVVVAKTLNLMDFWNFYFWSALVITFAITAISARIPPLTRIDNTGGVADTPMPFAARLRHAVQSGLAVSRSAGNPGKILLEHFLAGVRMASAILPSIMGIGLAGLLLAKYTSLFDWLGFLLYPATWAMGLEQPLVAAKAMASGLAEMFLPAILLKGAEAGVLLRYVVGVVSISSIIFFSGLVPCILATRIPLSLGHMLLVWLQRTILGIVFAAAFGYLGLAMGWIA
ncbi:MAG: YjiH family protein [Cardiobacteriaceae bacterium]|nr:YjiH family protein [Cardiobacteriaceae bacterium]